MTEKKIQKLGDSICEKLNILFGVDDFEFIISESEDDWIKLYEFDSYKMCSYTREGRSTIFYFCCGGKKFNTNVDINHGSTIKGHEYAYFMDMVEFIKQLEVE